MKIERGIKTTIDDISSSIRITMNNIEWKAIKEPYGISKYKYKDGVGTLIGINDEYTLSITAKKLFDKTECAKFPWKICKYDVSISIDKYEIMKIVVSSGNQYPLISEYISQFVFSKLWAKYCSTYTAEQKLNWF